MKDKNIIYVVMNDGKPIYASLNKDKAHEYADKQIINGTADILHKRHINDPYEDDLEEAAFISGLEGGYYEVVEVDIGTEEDIITIENGYEVELMSIMAVIDIDD